MGLPYESTFQISVSGEHGDDAARLGGIVSRLQRELSAGGSDIELESGEAAAYSYAVISTERPHPSLGDQMMQLEVRLCAAGDGPVEASFRSRFISADGDDPPDLRAGPPRLLLWAVEGLECSAGGFPVSLTAPTIGSDAVDSFVAETVDEARRALPVLVCSERADGTALLDPERIQRELVGLAQVARLSNAANSRFRELTGLACYNGAARWFWPGSRGERGAGRPNAFCPQSKLQRRDALYRLQQTALEHAAGNAFDSYYSRCRTEVILARNQALEQEAARRAVPWGEPGGELRRALRKEQVRAVEASRRLQQEQGRTVRMEQELADARSRIEELEAGIEVGIEGGPEAESQEAAGEARREIRELRSRLSDREKTVNRLNSELQAYRQQERARPVKEGMALALGSVHPGWLTLCNHALNLYRDPMRRFIVGRLREAYRDQLKQRLMRSVDFADPNVSYREREPESAIDVRDFESLVQDNRPCFEREGLQWRQLGDIRRFRNRVAHPPVDGLDAATVQDGLRNIREVLECVGAKDAAKDVSALVRLVRDG